jgi:hypothetical protein
LAEDTLKRVNWERVGGSSLQRGDKFRCRCAEFKLRLTGGGKGFRGFCRLGLLPGLVPGLVKER